MINFDTSSWERILEYQFVRFIDTTPSLQTPTWVLIGAVEEGGAVVEYNPNVDRIKYIVHKNASTNHTSNDKQMDVTYQSYKGDPCFEFVNNARDKTNVRTNLLEVDLWNKDTNGKYSAKMSEATLVVSNNNGQEIGFNVYADGDPEEGKVTITTNTPSFTPTTSL